MTALEKDPINLIITGVGGQGNVLISWLMGETLLAAGYQVTIGETYGVSQRGGPVASHIRISKKKEYGAITPEGQADIILSLEPMEALRILGLFGSRQTYVITNSRPVHPMAVSMGETEYPDLERLRQAIEELAQRVWYLDASQIAINLGVPLIANMVMVGALISTELLPLSREAFESELEANFKGDRLKLNRQALAMGIAAGKSGH